MRRFSNRYFFLLATSALAVCTVMLQVDDVKAQSGSRNVSPTGSSHIYSPPAEYSTQQPTSVLSGGTATGSTAPAYADPGYQTPVYAPQTYPAPVPAYSGSPCGGDCGCGTPSCGGPARWPTLPRCAPATGRKYFQGGAIRSYRPFNSPSSGCSSCGY